MTVSVVLIIVAVVGRYAVQVAHTRSVRSDAAKWNAIRDMYKARQVRLEARDRGRHVEHVSKRRTMRECAAYLRILVSGSPAVSTRVTALRPVAARQARKTVTQRLPESVDLSPKPQKAKRRT